jgi:hypothetical protein
MGIVLPLSFFLSSHKIYKEISSLLFKALSRGGAKKLCLNLTYTHYFLSLASFRDWMESNQSMLKNHISIYISSVLYVKHQILQAQQSSLQLFGRERQR